MANIPLTERIKTIIDLAVSQSFFITLFVIFLLTIVALIINTRVKSRAPKYMVAIAYTGIAILLLARYGKYMLSLNDSIVDKFFRAMYFPNIVVYIAMLVLTILFIVMTVLNDKYLMYTKICNFLCFVVIWFLFVLTVDSVKREGLSFYEVTDIYANGTIMILMQASMCIFFIWCAILISDAIVRRISEKMEKKELQHVSPEGQIVENDSVETIPFFEDVLNNFKKDNEGVNQDDN